MRLRPTEPLGAPALLGVPAYFYPFPGDLQWAALADAPSGSFVVITPDNGPGTAQDPGYVSALAPLLARGIVVYGYVDSGYAARDVATLLAEAETYVEWYGVGGIFVDQVTATPEHRSAYETLSDALRAKDLRVAFNPGQPIIDPRYLDLADQVCVFEGTQADYLRLRFPAWMADVPANRLWHLVYEVDDDVEFARVARVAARHHAGTLFATNGRMPNPWDRLPPYWSHMVQA